MSSIVDRDAQFELPLEYDRFLRYPNLRARGIPYSRQHLSELEEKGLFPRRYRLSARTIGWKESEIVAWMNSRARGGRGSAR